MTTAVAKRPADRIREVVSADSVKAQFDQALKQNAGTFISSIIELYSTDTNLQKCEPGEVVMECLKAASLKLVLNKNLGFAYIIPYGNRPQFQIGYKGIIQLAQRTGQFRYLNADAVYEGMTVEKDYLTGKVVIMGTPTNGKVIGVFAYMELLNGFTKTIHMTVEEVHAHAKKFSKTYTFKDGPWKINFEPMALKTAILKLSKYFPITIEMAKMMDQANEDSAIAEIEENANTGEIIDMVVEDVTEEAQPDDAKKAPF